MFPPNRVLPPALHPEQDINAIKDALQKLDNNFNSTEEFVEAIANPDPNMADQLALSLNSLSVRGPEPYSAEDPSVRASDFVKDFQDYLATTRVLPPAKIRNAAGQEIDNPQYGVLEKQIIKQYLKGRAKTWFRNLDPDTGYDDVIRSLKARFDYSENEKHAEKLKVFRLTQEPNQSFLDFVQNVLDRSRHLGLSERDMVSIVEAGCHLNIRPFIKMAQKTNISDIVKLPLAREDEDGLCDFVALTDIMSEDNCAEEPQPDRFENNDLHAGEVYHSTQLYSQNRSWNQNAANSSPGSYQPHAQSRDSQQWTRRPDHVNAAYSQPSSQWSQMNQHRTCGNCGYFTCPRLFSQFGVCVAYGKNCNFCNEIDHFANVCMSRQSSNAPFRTEQARSSFDTRQFDYLRPGAPEIR